MHQHLKRHRRVQNWPVVFWEGWISWECLTPHRPVSAVEFADHHGADHKQQVSRWREGLEGARRARALALFDAPPGPRDRPSMYEVFADPAALGLIFPAEKFRRGQLVFKSSQDRTEGPVVLSSTGRNVDDLG